MADQPPNNNNPTYPDPLANSMMQDFVRIFLAHVQQQQQQSASNSNNNSLSSVKLPSPRPYNGVRDPTIIDNWIYSIETHQRVYGMNDEKTFWFAKALLEDSAQSWVRYIEDPDNLQYIAPTTWTELKKIIIHKFRPTNDVDLARDVLVEIVQTKSISAYVDEFMKAIMAVKNISDAEATDRFMRGLKDRELKANIRAISANERTLDRVFDTALAYEFSHYPDASRSLYAPSSSRSQYMEKDDPMQLDVVQGNRTSSSRGGSGNSSSQNNNNSNNKNNSNNNRSSSSSRGVRNSDLVCEYCNKRGHKESRCYIRAEKIIAAAENVKRGGKGKSKSSLNVVEDNCDNKNNDGDDVSAYSVEVINVNNEVVDEKDDINEVNNVVDVVVVDAPVEPVVAVEDIIVDGDDKDDVPPVIEAVPIIPFFSHASTTENTISSATWIDSIYLATLLNATSSSILPLYEATVFTERSSTVNLHVLIDSGASENYISPKVANLIKCTRTKVYGREVETAGGNITPITEKVVFELNLQGYQSTISAYIFDTKFDLILGRAFLKKHNPTPDWFDDTWKLCDSAGQVVTVKPSSFSTVKPSAKPQLNYLISHLQAEDILKEDGVESCFLYLLDEKKDNSSGGRGVDAEHVVWTKQLMEDFPSVFKDKLSGLPPVRDDFTHVINLHENAQPINRPPFRMSPAELDELRRQLDELSSLGFIRPSSSPWGAPVLFVKKKDGTMRMCIDYRAINKLTVRNATPLPRIDECLDRLQGASWFTSLDLRSGYHQIRIQDSDIPKTAFNTRYGKYEFLVLPFGLSNSPPSYQAWMNNILKDCIDKFALIYLDDACIYSKTLEEHISHVRHVISIFESHGLVVNLKKCEFGKRELEFLGFRVSADGILPSLSKVKAIQDWIRPTNVQEVRQFLGLAQHYRRFCPSFSSIASPLTQLTHGTGAKKRAILWNDECEASFLKIKHMLTSPPLLLLPNMQKPFRIECDASDFGVGAVLLQQDDKTDAWLPIAYESKKLSPAEQKFPAQEREFIAIMHALRTWRCFIDGCVGGYTVFCDHKPLVYFASQLKPTPRLVRWIAEYEMFSPNIEYKPGKENDVADALSRRADLLSDDGPVPPPLEPDYLYASWDLLSHDLRMDWPLLYINNAHHKVKSSALQKKLEKEEDLFVVRQNQVYRKVTTEDGKIMELKFIPFAERADLVFKYHEAFGHAGIKTMLKMFSARYWWPALRKDIQDWLRTCAPCQLNSNKSKAHQAVMHPLDVPKAFDRWHLDFVGELQETESGNKWLLTAVDYLTNWPIARAVPVASQEAVADFIYEEIVMRFGCPSEIITDRGANFTSGLVKAYTKRVGINHKLTSAFHPRSNSKVERYNGIIKQMLRKYVNGAIHRWDDFVNAALWASRIRVHSTTGFSPFYLTYGREPRLPGDILQPYLTRESLSDPRTIHDINSRELQLLGQHRAAAEFRLKAMGEQDKRKWDEKIKPLSFEVGDLVLVTHEGKFGLEPQFKGPFMVTQVFPEYDTYQLETVAGEPLQSLIHVDRLRPFLGDKPDTPHYDPTSARREVREAERSRPPRTIKAGPSSSKPSSAVLPSATTASTSPVDLLVPDRIDPTVNEVANSSSSALQSDLPSSSGMLPVVAQADPQQEIIPSSLPTTTFTTPVEEDEPDLIDEDISVHGSSVMDEDNEDIVRFRHILDGYDDMSSAEEEIYDTDIEEAAPPVVSPSVVEELPEAPVVPPPTPTTVVPEAVISPPPQIIPDTTTAIPTTTTTVIEEDIVPEEPDNSDMVEVSSPPPTPQQPPSSSPPVLSDSTITATTSSVPVSRFSFKPPVPTSAPIPSGFSPSSATSSSAKPLNLSSRLLPSLRPSSSSSSSKPTVPSADNLPGDVQGRTSISKGGDVGFDIDYDLEYEVKVSKINKNKRKQFRPITPMRDKKRRLRLQFIAQTIINSLAAKLQK